MSEMTKWLKGITYTIAAIVLISVVATGGLVFLAIGAIIGLISVGAMAVAFVAYLIKEAWEHAVG